MEYKQCYKLLDMTKIELQEKYNLLIDKLKELDIYVPRAYGDNYITLDKHNQPCFGRDDDYDSKVVKHSDIQTLLSNCL